MQSRFGAALAAGLAVAALVASASAAQEAAAPVPPAPQPYVAGAGAAAAAPKPKRPAGLAALAPAVPPAAVAPLAPPRPGARLAPGTPIPPAELEAFIDGVVREAMASDHIAGAAVSVVQGGQVVLKKGYGYASQSPAHAVDPDRTLFRLGSISKTFTWIAVMKQVEGGRMVLGNPVNQYLPQRLQVRDQGYSRAITVLDLMSHTSGFEDRIMGQLFERNPDRIRPLAVYLRQERPRRVREAGTLPVYSNYGAALAGEAASEVAGQPFDRMIELEIIRPLGMSRTSFREPYQPRHDIPDPIRPDLGADISQGFRWADGRLQARPFEYLTQTAPAGAASSTASDMARYMNLILGDGTLDGVTIYSRQTAAAFRTVNARGAPGVAGWAHGFHEERLPGDFVGYGHHGDTLSFHSSLVTVPALGLGVFIAANTETAERLTQRLPQLIVERFYGGPRAPPQASSDQALRPADYAGVYLSERRAFSGLEKFLGVLTRSATLDVTPEGRLVTKIGDEAQSWIPLGGGRFQSADGPDVSVFSAPGGQGARWYAPWGGEVFQRAGPLSTVTVLLTLAVLTVTAAIATLIGLVTRDRRDFRQTSVQSRASAMQTAGSILWFVSVAGFVLWALSVGNDRARAVYDWPGPWLLLASACALVASLLAVVALILLPAIWKGGRRLDSWTLPRKLRFTATALVFIAFAAALAVNGALEPWSG